MADEALKPVAPFVKLARAESRVEGVKDRIAELVNDDMYDIMMCAEDYMYRRFDLERTLRERMSALPYEKFEQLLHPIFKAEEWKLVLVGAVVGLIFGTLQVLFVVGR